MPIDIKEFQKRTGFPDSQIKRFTIIEAGDFIESTRGSSSLRGHVIEEGIGRGKAAIPQWKIKIFGGAIRSIPKDDARVVQKSEAFFRSLEREGRSRKPGVSRKLGRTRRRRP